MVPGFLGILKSRSAFAELYERSGHVPVAHAPRVPASPKWRAGRSAAAIIKKTPCFNNRESLQQIPQGVCLIISLRTAVRDELS